MTTVSLIAEVGCPVCGRLVARVDREAEGGIAVEHRLHRGVNERDVENRPWNKSDLGDGEAVQWWPCGCGDVSCGGLLVLEGAMVRQLVRRSESLGYPIRWTPTGEEVVRSERLKPKVLRYLPHSADLNTLVMTEPPPPAQVRRLKVRA